jgi:uncharacterized protein YdeI (YjbR/CyaY-like superfamily)
VTGAAPAARPRCRRVVAERRTPRPVGANDEHVQPADRAEWRAWLEANHRVARGVWAVTYRRSAGKPTVAYDDLVEEALCFGWIDSQGGRLDDERGKLRFTPRKRGSVWARSNKQRVERLVAAGLMTEAGLRAIETAKADGSWDALTDVDDLREPEDLAGALAADGAARRGFDAMSPSTRRMILWWVVSSKRPETRARRIDTAVRAAADGRNPLERPSPPAQTSRPPRG